MKCYENCVVNSITDSSYVEVCQKSKEIISNFRKIICLQHSAIIENIYWVIFSVSKNISNFIFYSLIDFGKLRQVTIIQWTLGLGIL